MGLPKRLNFGSGKSFAPDMLNIDILPARNPDLVLDLSQPFPFDRELATRRFGPIAIPRGSFDYILADNVMEHVPDLIQTMTNCLELLALGGELEVRVPYDLSYGAWQDPTHVRAFNERSWVYYCDWAWYVGWIEARFEVISLVCKLSDYGRGLAASCDNDMNVIARHPRAVDEIQVRLRKMVIGEEERAMFLSMIGGNTDI